MTLDGIQIIQLVVQCGALGVLFLVLLGIYKLGREWIPVALGVMREMIAELKELSAQTRATREAQAAQAALSTSLAGGIVEKLDRRIAELQGEVGRLRKDLEG